MHAGAPEVPFEGRISTEGWNRSTAFGLQKHTVSQRLSVRVRPPRRDATSPSLCGQRGYVVTAAKMVTMNERRVLMDGARLVLVTGAPYARHHEGPVEAQTSNAGSAGFAERSVRGKNRPCSEPVTVVCQVSDRTTLF